MKKNSQIHLFIETPELDKLKRESKELGLTISELCRRKIVYSSNKLDRLEELILRFEKNCNHMERINY